MLNPLFSLKALPAAGWFPIQLGCTAWPISCTSIWQVHSSTFVIHDEGVREDTVYLKVLWQTGIEMHSPGLTRSFEPHSFIVCALNWTAWVQGLWPLLGILRQLLAPWAGREGGLPWWKRSTLPPQASLSKFWAMWNPRSKTTVHFYVPVQDIRTPGASLRQFLFSPRSL